MFSLIKVKPFESSLFSKSPTESSECAIRRIFSTVAALVLVAPGAKSAWQTGNGFRSTTIKVPEATKPGFTLLTNSALGIAFTNTLALDRMMLNNNLLNGSGVATGDFDGDGLCDVYLCGLGGRNALYRNLGNWRFEDVTDKAGVACSNQLSTGAVFADINGDGRPDLLVTSCGGPNACLVNEGNGHFINATEAAGLGSKLGSTSMALADVDSDGDLDLYVVNYGENTIRSGLSVSTRMVGGKEVVTGRYANRLKIIDGKLVEFGEPDILYLNDGKGKFTPVPWTEGAFLDADGKPLASAPWDMGLAVQMRDINADGHTDIYVANDFHTPDRIWLGDGKGHFRALPRNAITHTSYFSMSVDFADINRDGFVDWFIADMSRRSHASQMRQRAADPPTLLPGERHDHPQTRRNSLFLNRGDGTWTDIANYAGVGASDWTWSGVFLDVDLDGFEDLLIGNGHAFDAEDMDASELIQSLGKQRQQDSRTNILHYPKLDTPNALFRNRGDLTFEDVSTRWGFDSRQVSHGIALGDFDNDGDLDVVVNCLNEPPLIYRNEAAAPRLAVRLKGQGSNSQGIGALVELTGGPVRQSQEIIAGGRYLSGSDPLRVFASGAATSGMSLRVRWPSNRESVLTNVQASHIYEIDESNSVVPPPAQDKQVALLPPLFEDVSSKLNHAAKSQPQDQFARQPLLPKRTNTQSPGVAWVDLDGDEKEDLVINGGADGALHAYRNDGTGGFLPIPTPSSALSAGRGYTAGIPSPAGAAASSLLVGTESLDRPSETAGLLHRLTFDPQSKVIRTELFPNFATLGGIGAMTVGDSDGDGELELFVAGRPVPGRYPESTPSHFFRNSGGTLKLEDNRIDGLKEAGLVNAAMFSDLNDDGFPELILACEWGPIRVFQNDRGRFTEKTSVLGLSKFTGWWQGIAVGDFDEDGRLDIVASNWGLNSAYTASPSRPALLYCDDFSGSGGLDLIEAGHDSEQNKIVPLRILSDVATVFPAVRAKFSTHKSYSTASIADLLGDKLSAARELKATTLASMLFLNRGDHFEPVQLPAEAQWTPAFGITVADFDGDSHQDVFLAQNFSGVPGHTPPLREGRGMLLRGDGKGRFTTMSPSASGISIEGDQRACAVSDFDQDGKPDLVVTQHGSPTKLFRNSTAPAGVRISLKGPAGNPRGIGATVRMPSGPAMAILGGSGHWSQDSTTCIFPRHPSARKFSIRWLGGKLTTVDLPQNAKAIRIGESGLVE